MLFRVGEAGCPALQLRPGELGISIFDTDAVHPELEEQEIVNEFRPESLLIEIDRAHIENLQLMVVPVAGADSLPERLRRAHAEIRPNDLMPRRQFKRQLKELERHVN